MTFEELLQKVNAEETGLGVFCGGKETEFSYQGNKEVVFTPCCKEHFSMLFACIVSEVSYNELGFYEMQLPEEYYDIACEFTSACLGICEEGVFEKFFGKAHDEESYELVLPRGFCIIHI